MRNSFFISVFLHIFVFVVAYVGIPMLPDDDLIVEAPIVVEVVNIDDVSNVPAPQPKAKKPDVKKPQPKKAKPKPPPPAPPKPEPAPEPAREPEEAEIIPDKKSKPKPKKKEPEQQVQKPAPRVKSVKLARKPKPPQKNDFESLMKNLAPTLDKVPKADKKKEQEDFKLDDLAKEIQEAIKKPSKFSDPNKKLSISEIDALRAHIEKCWNPPIGAREAENLKIEIRIAMNPDGTPRSYGIVSNPRMSDPFYRAAAESARRAVGNRRCWPYPLSPETYQQWRDLTLVFDPKHLLGL
ncbi:hypothetical protein [Terasakiella sp. SH-1]|uniref:hypothetical protein n=1 Tax=Terasakiella sp. SH-1 TaxID=2560057 RepID=UPI0010731D66|nr:hypothetical protein [Terasakiella sp. SH-1]